MKITYCFIKLERGEYQFLSFEKIQISRIPNLGSGIAINDMIQRASKS